MPQSLVTTSSNSQSATTKADTGGDPNTIEAQRDVYRRMLNYSMSSTLAQQYYLSQYGYNYLQVRLRSCFWDTELITDSSKNGRQKSLFKEISWLRDNLNTIKPVDKGHPMERQRMVFIDKWSLFLGYIVLFNLSRLSELWPFFFYRVVLYSEAAF